VFSPDRFDWSGNWTVSETTSFSYYSEGWTYWTTLWLMCITGIFSMCVVYTLYTTKWSTFLCATLYEMFFEFTRSVSCPMLDVIDDGFLSNWILQLVMVRYVLLVSRWLILIDQWFIEYCSIKYCIRPIRSEHSYINKKCDRQVWPTRYAPRLPLMTQVQHFVTWIKKRQRWDVQMMWACDLDLWPWNSCAM